MELRVLACPRCGAPLPKRAALVQVICEYCKAEVTVERYAIKAQDYRRAWAAYSTGADSNVLTVERVPLRLLGRIAIGHSSDVWLAVRTTRLSERLIVKRLRSNDDETLLQNEQTVLRQLEASTSRGSQHFTTLLPQRALYGHATQDGRTAGLLAAFREPIGFAHTLLELTRAYPGGCDPRHLVWLWRRSLELLSWLHLSGIVHGALLPAHVLLNARDHAVMFVGWSCAAPAGTALRIAAAADLELYPRALLEGGPLSPRTDLCMLARALLRAAGASAGQAHERMPAGIARLLEREARGDGGDDAWQLGEQVAQAAREDFGPAQFVELTMPSGR